MKKFTDFLLIASISLFAVLILTSCKKDDGSEPEPQIQQLDDSQSQDGWIKWTIDGVADSLQVTSDTTTSTGRERIEVVTASDTIILDWPYFPEGAVKNVRSDTTIIATLNGNKPLNGSITPDITYNGLSSGTFNLFYRPDNQWVILRGEYINLTRQ